MKRPRFAMPIAGAAGLLVVLTGCISGPPAEQAVSRSSAAVVSGIENGVRAIDEQDRIALRARYNPCRCGAPDFEARLRGRWRRVVVESPDDTMQNLEREARSRHREAGLYFFRLVGQFDGRTPYGGTEVEYRRFELVDFEVLSYEEVSRDDSGPS